MFVYICYEKLAQWTMVNNIITFTSST